MKQEFKDYIEAKFKEINNANYYVKYLDMQDECYRLTNRVLSLQEENKRLQVYRNKALTSLTELGADMTLHEMEKRMVLHTLKHFEGNKTQTAEALGITIKTLYNKLHEYDAYDQYKTSHNEP